MHYKQFTPQSHVKSEAKSKKKKTNHVKCMWNIHVYESPCANFFSVIPSNSILLNIFTHFLCHLKMHIHLLFDTSPPQSEFHKCVKMFIPWIKKKPLKPCVKCSFFVIMYLIEFGLCIHVDYLQVYAITVINFYFYLLMYCIKVSIHIIWHK